MLCGHRRPQVGEPARLYSSLLYICYCKHKTKIKGTRSGITTRRGRNTHLFSNRRILQ